MTTSSSTGAAKPLVPYIRQSRAKERTISLDEQMRSIRSWAEREGVELAPEIVEQGVSGSKHWRERALGQAVEDCEQGQASGIVVAFQDRLSRENALATAEVWEALERAGARLVASAEGLDTSAGDQEMLFTIKAAIAREQWKRHRANWANARRAAVERGVHPCARLPVGYTDTDGDRRLLPDPVTADAVKSAFRLRGQGASLTEIAQHLESEGVHPPKGSRWITNVLQKMFSSPVYLGHAFHGEFVNESAHEPLVTRAEWLAAQVKQPSRVRRGGPGARLTGIVFCASCGGRMSPSPGANRYRCVPRRRSADQPCEAPAHISMSKLDALVVDKFLERYKDAFGSVIDEPTAPELEPLRKRLDDAQRALESFLEDTDFLAALKPDQRMKLLDKLNADVEEARLALDSVEVKNVTSVANVIDLGDYFEPSGFAEAEIPEQRRLLLAGIERVVVAKGKGDTEKRVSIDWKT